MALAADPTELSADADVIEAVAQLQVLDLVFLRLELSQLGLEAIELPLSRGLRSPMRLVQRVGKCDDELLPALKKLVDIDAP